MKVVFETRFSFLGQSGWQSDESKSADLLFADDRMDYRFELFEKITLASLVDQTDDDFDLAILISDIFPQHHKDRLRELCYRMIGEDRTKFIEYGPFKAGRIFRNFIRENYADFPYVAQVVLDDDDAVSADFVEACKHEARAMASARYDDDGTGFLTFMRGFSLIVKDRKLVDLSPKHSAYLNLGLTLVAPPNTTLNPFLVSHLNIGIRYSTRVINTLRPFYLRTIHDHNDSRAPHKKQWLSPEEISEVSHYFPFLFEHFDTNDLPQEQTP